LPMKEPLTALLTEAAAGDGPFRPGDH
jgi:hypothetical protein